MRGFLIKNSHKIKKNDKIFAYIRIIPYLCKNFKSLFMIKDFYIRYGASSCTFLYNFIRIGHDSIKLYSRGSKFIVVKNRDILFESCDYYEIIHYFRNLIYLEFSDIDLFNN